MITSTLSFAGQNLKWNKAENAQPVADAILAMKELKVLELEANTLGVEAAEVIGHALAHHPEFERAHWKDLFTGRLKTEIPQALKHLFSGLMRAGAKLIELDLSDNALGPVGVEGMVDFISSPVCYSLQELRLNNNGLGIKGGTMLAESLLKLTENAKAAGSPLQLKVFISGRNRLEKEGAKIFAKFFSAVGTLEEVAMPQNGIFHEGIADLAKSFSANPSLRIINLNDNTFTAVGAKAMAHQLPSMQNLEIINFGDCLLKTNGAKYIAQALMQGHPKLRELFLDSNEIGIEGGLMIIEAIENKPNLTNLMIDANQFGEDGRVVLQAALDEIEKLTVLNTLDDDEEPDSDEDDGDDDDGDEEEELDDYVDDDVEETVSDSGVSPLKREACIVPMKCTASEFRENPTAARLLGLGSSATSQLIEEAHQCVNEDCVEDLINSYFDLIMRISSMSTTNNKLVHDTIQSCTSELARVAFASAEKEHLTSVATNSLLVHLDLIKSENKKFKLEWDIKGCLINLVYIASQPYFPADTKATLQFFFSRPNPSIGAHKQEIHNLMKVLFR